MLFHFPLSLFKSLLFHRNTITSIRLWIQIKFSFHRNERKKGVSVDKTLEQVSCFYFLSKTFERLTTISVYNYNETFGLSAERDPENIAFLFCSSGSLYHCVCIVIQTMTDCADWQAGNKGRGDYCAAAFDDI